MAEDAGAVTECVNLTPRNASGSFRVDVAATINSKIKFLIW